MPEACDIFPLNTLKTFSCHSPPLTLHQPRRNRQNHHQTNQYQRPRNHTHDNHAAPARGEPPAYDIVLRLEVAVEPNAENHNRYGDEGGAERLSDVAEVRGGGVCAVAGRRVVVEGGVEAEELSDCDADGGEGEGGAEPGEEGSFFGGVSPGRKRMRASVHVLAYPMRDDPSRQTPCSRAPRCRTSPRSPPTASPLCALRPPLLARLAAALVCRVDCSLRLAAGSRSPRL